MNLPDIYLKFMKPDVWNGLVLASIFIGLAWGIVRLMKDRAVYTHRQRALLSNQSASSQARSSRSHEQDQT